MFTHDGSARSGLFRIAYPDTGESGDAYDIDMQKELTTRTGLELPVPSPSISTLTFGTAESGDAYDAEVDQFSGEQMDDGLALQATPLSVDTSALCF